MPQEEKKHISITMGLLIILAAAVIIGGGAIAYFYVNSPTSWDYMGNRTAVHKTSNANTNTSNTNSTTADWKTYTDTDYGYSVKYPTDWTVDLTSKDSSGKVIATFLAPGTSNTPHTKMIDIQVSPTSSVSKVGSSDYLVNNDNINPITSQASITVSGIKTTKLITNLNNGYDIITYVDKSPNTYTISLVNTKSTDTDYINALDNILSTFQFTK